MIARAVPAACAALLLLGAAHSVPSARVAALVKHDPRYPLLAEYDRQIAALRATERLPGLEHPGATIRHSEAAVRDESAAARMQVDRMARAWSATYAARERNALSNLAFARAFSTGGAQQGAQRELAAYRDQVTRETAAAIAAYRDAIVQRTQRAIAARARELRERESALAYDLAKRTAGPALAVKLKLDYLHLDPASRAPYEAHLSSLRAADAARLDAATKADAATLAAYRARLERTAAADDSRTTLQLEAKAAANIELRRSIVSAETAARTQALAGDLAARAAAFRRNYDFARDAATIESGFARAAAGVEARFATLEAAATASRAATDVQIAALQADRHRLYEAILSSASTQNRR